MSPIPTLAIICLIVLSLVFGYGYYLVNQTAVFPYEKIDGFGVFGDSFGILTSLFSGLAFAGIIVTVWMQKNELKLQRDELKLTRLELESTREVMVSQHETAKTQNFESTFFQMLSLHNEIVNSIDLYNSTRDRTTSGRDCFSIFLDNFKYHYRNAKEKNPAQSDRDAIFQGYEKFWHQSQADLGHYFRYLYNIFKFVNETENIDQRFYARIVRAQISDQELALLFYNCIYKFGSEKFKPLAEKFTLFDNLPVDLLLEINHRDLYSPSAFHYHE